jgi:hypothetical protein
MLAKAVWLPNAVGFFLKRTQGAGVLKMRSIFSPFSGLSPITEPDVLTSGGMAQDAILV